MGRSPILHEQYRVTITGRCCTRGTDKRQSIGKDSALVRVLTGVTTQQLAAPVRSNAQPHHHAAAELLGLGGKPGLVAFPPEPPHPDWMITVKSKPLLIRETDLKKMQTRGN
jgi:hypothetical protein